MVGSFFLSIKKVLKKASGGSQNGVYQWVNAYGAPYGVSGENTDKMNKNPDHASSWKGRILIMYYVEDTKNPVMIRRDMNPVAIREAGPYI